MAKQLGFYFDSTSCIGCRACQIACKDKNDLPVGQTWRQVVEVSGGNWTQQEGGTWTTSTFTYYLSLGCQHCEKPFCAEVCPTGAMTKRADGVVLVNQDQCIGCRYCEWACPYGSPQFNAAKGVMGKCNLCEDYVAQGKKPACVDACVMRALDIGELADLQAKYGNIAQVDPLPVASLTHPSIVLTPHLRSQMNGAAKNLTLDKGGMK
jgi:anaerobic dimethyl sulfoxide reductase subunit B (iron-sulfur subunit)